MKAGWSNSRLMFFHLCTFCSEKLAWVPLVPAAGQSLGEVGAPEQRGLQNSTISRKIRKVVGIHLEFYGDNMRCMNICIYIYKYIYIYIIILYIYIIWHRWWFFRGASWHFKASLRGATQAADSVLDRLPAHRRNLFEEEQRKLSKDSSFQNLR